jgi:hypothetical protein
MSATLLLRRIVLTLLVVGRSVLERMLGRIVIIPLMWRMILLFQVATARFGGNPRGPAFDLMIT